FKAEEPLKDYYEWSYEGVPYRKIIYWFSDPVPQIHEEVYKISWGPSWVREFIGNSEHMKFIGASERFIGSSNIFMGSSEIFLGGSEKFLGGSEQFPGASENLLRKEEEFPGASEIFIGSSNNLIPVVNNYYYEEFS